MAQKKNFYYILLDDEYVGQTWAVSEEKATNNFWWNNCKGGDPFAYTDYKPSDFEAICIS